MYAIRSYYDPFGLEEQSVGRIENDCLLVGHNGVQQYRQFRFTGSDIFPRIELEPVFVRVFMGIKDALFVKLDTVEKFETGIEARIGGNLAQKTGRGLLFVISLYRREKDLPSVVELLELFGVIKERDQAAEILRNGFIRITSYNVCYTKLLRRASLSGGTPGA